MVEEPITIVEDWIDDSVMDKLSKSSHEKKYKGIHCSIEHSLTGLGMLSFSKGRWDNLIYLGLTRRNNLNILKWMGNTGCKYLSRVHLPHIKIIIIRIIAMKQSMEILIVVE
jgi:hypothetical protein